MSSGRNCILHLTAYISCFPKVLQTLDHFIHLPHSAKFHKHASKAYCFMVLLKTPPQYDTISSFHHTVWGLISLIQNINSRKACFCVPRRTDKRESGFFPPSDQMDESRVVLIYILFVTKAWCSTEIWTLHLKPAEPPHHYNQERFPQWATRLCFSPLFLCWQFESGTPGKEREQSHSCHANPAMQVFTARSKNIQRDPEQVVLNKLVLSCWVCLLDATKIRWAGQFRPGIPWLVRCDNQS